ncbi:MAG: hypothetical protein ACI4Q9_05290 [Candidatus Methanomethylophilaceae archaeon]
MRMNRKGVVSTPVKLLMISVILTISFPVMAEALESGERTMDVSTMENESRRIADAAASVYYSVNGATRTLEVNIPDGCSMVIGGSGDDAFAIHMYRNGILSSEHWMEKPIIPFSDITEISGTRTLSISFSDGSTKVAVV